MRAMVILAACLGCALVGVAALPQDEAPVEGGLVTLYQRDPLAGTLGFTSGDHGGVFRDFTVRNRQSDLDFGHYHEGAFTVGIEGGRIGAIVDLGTPDELQARYGYRETVGGGQGFASIRREGSHLVIRCDDGQRTSQELGSLEELFGELQGQAHAPIQDGHVYLVRLRDRHDERFALLVKLLVVRYEPGVAVTLRWQRIEEGGAS